MTTDKNDSWNWDLRVRERNLRSGALKREDLERYLSSLPDLDGTTDPFETPQPALEPPPPAEEPVAAAAAAPAEAAAPAPAAPGAPVAPPPAGSEPQY